MNTAVRPGDVGPPSANYELATLAAADPGWKMRQLFTSGIGPTRVDGSVPEAIDEQAEVVWLTLASLLDEADMVPSDVVQVTTFVVAPAAESDQGPDGESLSVRLAAAMDARDGALGQHRCASVLVPVPALATSTWKMEVALVAISSG